MSEVSKKTKSKNPRFSKTNKGKTILLKNCVVFHGKKLRFIIEQEASGLLSSLRLETPSSKIPPLGDMLFWRYQMHEIVNKILLAADKFMPEIHDHLLNTEEQHKF